MPRFRDLFSTINISSYLYVNIICDPVVFIMKEGVFFCSSIERIQFT